MELSDYIFNTHTHKIIQFLEKKSYTYQLVGKKLKIEILTECRYQLENDISIQLLILKMIISRMTSINIEHFFLN